MLGKVGLLSESLLAVCCFNLLPLIHLGQNQHWIPNSYSSITSHREILFFGGTHQRERCSGCVSTPPYVRLWGPESMPKVSFLTTSHPIYLFIWDTTLQSTGAHHFNWTCWPVSSGNLPSSVPCARVTDTQDHARLSHGSKGSEHRSSCLWNNTSPRSYFPSPTP